MGIRALVALLFTVALLLGFGFVYALLEFLKSRLFDLFPEETLPQAQAALEILIFQEAAALAIFLALLGFVIYIVMAQVIVRPLRSIIAGMQTFADSGERVELPDLSGTPYEVKTLAEVFQQFVDKVDQVHKHDMEIARVKSDFISTAAHQLRTPLTGIRWALEALEKEDMTESQKALVKSAKDKSHDLVDTVGTLLDISAIESGKHKYVFAPLNMEELVAEVSHDFAYLAVEKKVSLYYAKSELPLPAVRADRSRIKWVLNNLIENAIRYTPAGGTVRVSTDAGENRLNVRVHDTGIGIPHTDSSNIFERFYRAPNAITKENQGNGLGLYIARTIAADHGGDLNFSSNEEGPGTTFILSLPLA